MDFDLADGGLAYFAWEDQIGLMIGRRSVMKLERATFPSFLEWFKAKGSSTHFLGMELLYWPRMKGDVLTAFTSNGMICLLFICEEKFEELYKDLESDYQKIIDDVYLPLVKIQEQYECTWTEAVTILRKERGEAGFTLSPDLEQ